MTAVRVLVLGSYPTRRPIHGGQLRLAQIVAAYRGQGFAVRQVNAFAANVSFAYTGYFRRCLAGASLDWPLSRKTLKRWPGMRVPFVEDLASGQIVAEDDTRLTAIERYAGRVDWVHLEQPWLLPVVRRLRERGALGQFQLVYGSQNIEYLLKKSIFGQYRVTEGEALLDAIETLEATAAREADLVASVTVDDARQLSQWTRAPIVPTPNGVQPWRSTVSCRREWQARLGGAPFALYVASAHPPNIAGFCESFGESLAPLSPSQRVVLAGTVAEHVAQSDWFRRWEALNARRVHVVGILDAADLAALKDMAHTFVLPVTSGGGSNLKTAEALYARRNVVATPFAMRGFEAFGDLPGLTVVAPGLAFAHAVAHSLSRPVPPAVAATRARCEHLTWSHALAPLMAAVGAAGGRS
jgi:hypothetical protein